MKLKFKALAAALALASAGHAVADIQPGNLASGATGGELFFYVYDDVTKNSYVKDLGVTYAAALAAGNTLTYSVAGSNNVGSDANWASYLTAQASDLSNSYWGVVTTEKTNALTANGVNAMTTARNNAPTNTQTSNLRGIDGIINTAYLVFLNTGNGVAANDSYFATGPTNPANFAAGTGINHNYNGKVQFQADNLVGSGIAASFYNLSAGAAASNPAVLTTLFSQAADQTSWRFDGNSVYIAAVPEPETYGMLAAGLLMLGAVARRRKAQD